MSGLQVYMLGTLEIRYGEELLPRPPTLKSQALLAYLILYRDQRHLRKQLAGLFWGDRPEGKARPSLSTALWRIRRCLPEEISILGDREMAQL